MLTLKSRTFAEPTKEESKPRAPSTPPGKASLDSGYSSEEEFEQAFRVFDFRRYAEPFAAPWGGKQAALGMLAWGAGFIGVGLAFLPLARVFTGPEGLAGMTPQDKAIFVLVNQIAEAAVGIAIVNAAVSNAKPLPPDFLKISFSNPFRKPDGWAAWGLLGVVLSPFVVYSAAVLSELIGIQDDPTARGTADAVSSLLVLDPLTFASLFGTTAILAPLLEETVFRGFLLPSLAKVMPTPLAVLGSAVAFGLVHFSPRDTPQLMALGVLMGFAYVRSRNLLTPMMIHSAWNGTVLVVLYYLQASGINVQEMLHNGGV